MQLGNIRKTANLLFLLVQAEQAEIKAGKLRDHQAGSAAIKREKHEKQRAVFLMKRLIQIPS